MGSLIEQLANSQRHLLTAQVLMNDRLDRAERAIQKTAETMQALAEQQKHTDSNLAALTDIVRRWYESHGNGSATH
jgi:peptidoglycan hydrolase CwlO-like protein